MTALDMVVIAAGLLFGYRLVSNYLSPNTDARPGADGRSDESSRRSQEPPAPKAPTWFEVLGVPENADLPEVERAYRVKIGQYHPDKVARLGEDIRQLAETKSKEINVAYETALRSARR